MLVLALRQHMAGVMAQVGQVAQVHQVAVMARVAVIPQAALTVVIHRVARRAGIPLATQALPLLRQVDAPAPLISLISAPFGVRLNPMSIIPFLPAAGPLQNEAGTGKMKRNALNR